MSVLPTPGDPRRLDRQEAEACREILLAIAQLSDRDFTVDGQNGRPIQVDRAEKLWASIRSAAGRLRRGSRFYAALQRILGVFLELALSLNETLGAFVKESINSRLYAQANSPEARQAREDLKRLIEDAEKPSTASRRKERRDYAKLAIDLIRLLGQNRGATQEEAAQILGISARTLRRKRPLQAAWKQHRVGIEEEKQRYRGSSA